MTEYGRALRHLWALDDDMIFLNHGAYGATPRELFAVQDDWRARMEAQPVRFFMNDLPGLIREAATALAAFVDAPAERTVLLENATSGINAVLRSLTFAPGDRIVTTDHVYNAVRNTLRFAAERSGATVFEAPVALPLHDSADIVHAIEAAIDERTKLVVIDHIASPSALRFPVGDIVRLCRSHAIPVLVDGAHAPGHIDFSVADIDADWYVGNAHKWLCAPKGVAFLTARESAAEIHPTTISHAYGTGLTAEFGKIGSRDPSSWLSAKAAIDFHHRLGGPMLRQRNAALAKAASLNLATELGTVLAGPPAAFDAMVSLRLPVAVPATAENAAEIRNRLWDEHRVEALVIALAGSLWLRLSVHAYNDEEDFAPLPAMLRATLVATGAPPRRVVAQ